MSGPKCDSYYVENGSNALFLQAQRAEAERAARAARERLEAALERGRQARQQLEAAVKAGRLAEQQYDATISTLHEALPSFPANSSSLQEIENYIAAVQAADNQIASAIGRAEGLAQLRSLIAMPSNVAQVGDWTAELQERQSHSGPALAESSASKTRQEIIDRILSRIDGNFAQEELQSMQDIAHELLHAPSRSRAEILETELRLRVQRANDRAIKIRRDSETACGFLAQLRGLHGSEVESLRGELANIGNGLAPPPADLVQRVAAARKRAEKLINDEYAGQVVREELERLGYSIGTEFSTLFVDGGQAVVCRPEQAEYGVEMRVDADRGILDVAVVRFGDSEQVNSSERALRDKIAEEHWCTDHDRLRSAMRARGLQGRVIKRLPPGSQPVRATMATRMQESRRAGKPVLKQRELR